MKPVLLVGGIGVAIIALIGYNFIYVPRRHEVRVIETQRAEERVKQETAAEVAALLHQIERYRKRLPQEPDPSWLVREVVALAQKSGVEIASITQTAPQALGQFTLLAASVQFRASYHQLGRFLDDIERSDRFIRVESIHVAPFAGEELASIQLTFSTLFLPPVLNGAVDASSVPSGDLSS